MTVRPGKKFGFQSAAENLQRWRRPDRLRQTVPDRRSSRWKHVVTNGKTHSAWNDSSATCAEQKSSRKLSLAASNQTSWLRNIQNHRKSTDV